MRTIVLFFMCVSIVFGQNNLEASPGSVISDSFVLAQGDCVWMYFSPVEKNHVSCESAVICQIASAKSSLKIQMYTFTSQPILKAVLAAQARGVKVEVILDKSQLHVKGGVAQSLLAKSVPTWVDCKHAIAHNKIMIVDEIEVFTGSYNYSYAAEHTNAENLIVMTNASAVSIYEKNYNLHKAHSVVLTADLLKVKSKKKPVKKVVRQYRSRYGAHKRK